VFRFRRTALWILSVGLFLSGAAAAFAAGDDARATSEQAPEEHGPLEAQAYPGEPDPLIWRDGAGAIHLTDDPGSVPETYREKLVEPGAELSEIWDGEVLRRLPVPNDAKIQFELLRTPHFEVFWENSLADERVGPISGGRGAAPRVLGALLEEASVDVKQKLGLRSPGKVEVLLYHRSSYRDRYGEKFPFRTAGFYDGRIHVAADALASTRLMHLIRHEYSHALFREQVRSDRPFWLNEGFAELAGRNASHLELEELARLRGVNAEGNWVALRDLEAGFSRLRAEQVPWAYLESAAAAAWIEGQIPPRRRGELLQRRGGEALEFDAVFREFLGLGVDELDGVIRASLRSPETP